MSDELDRLKAAFGADRPAPDAAARARAKAAALAAFDAEAALAEKIAQEHQGSESKARLKDRHSRLANLFRRLQMTLTLPSTRTLMMGGTSLAVLAAATFATYELNQPGVDQYIDAERTSGGVDVKTRQSVEALAPVPQPADRTALQGALKDEAEILSQQPTPAVQPSPAATTTEADVATGASGLIETTRNAFSRERSSVPAFDIAPLPGYRDHGRDRFEEIDPNRVKVTSEEPVSTFSVDVDTASYSFMRKALQDGVLPPKDAVRIEELINYFPYDYAAPESLETPFNTHITVMDTPWNADTQLLRIGIKGYELTPEEKPRANLVFLIDTSGSMQAADKLPLLQNALKLLVENLDEDDTVSIVAYAGSAGTVLEPTSAADTTKIIEAINRLGAGGSTAGAEGIRQAYALAEQSYDAAAVNRVILATDGDFNVGITDTQELEGFVERKRDSGVMLSVLGFGRGNYNDALMQVLAQNGNGQAAYIDTLHEAQKTLVDEATSALFPIAQDVKIQVEFNPASIAEYRLIGYETRLLNREDFNNDRVDAGEIGSGHTVTALYEITPVTSDARQVDRLRYQDTAIPAGTSDELAFLRLRYKAPGKATSQLIERPVTASDVQTQGDAEARFAAAVAGFGQLLRGGQHTGEFGYEDVIDLANSARGVDPFGYRAEFVRLARLAKTASALETHRP